MKEIMLITIGVATGFTLCAGFLIVAMSFVTRNNKESKKYNEETIRLMRNRNETEERIADNLQMIADHITDEK